MGHHLHWPLQLQERRDERHVQLLGSLALRSVIRKISPRNARNGTCLRAQGAAMDVSKTSLMMDPILPKLHLYIS